MNNLKRPNRKDEYTKIQRVQHETASAGKNGLKSARSTRVFTGFLLWPQAVLPGKHFHGIFIPKNRAN